MSQTATNGKSLLGDLSEPLLAEYLTDTPLPDGFPWGKATAFDTNYYTSSPDTGVTRKYDWIVSRATFAPDGFRKPMIVVNGAFPGPLVEANWGDMIEITVHNDIRDPAEGTSFHWHGFPQQNTQWNDGVPAFTQCPISPGGSLTYTFKAELYGTSWWHAHHSAQYTAGLLGPVVIHGPQNVPYDIDIGPVLLSDWYHQEYHALVRSLVEPRPDPPILTSDNNLINGKMNFDCSKLNSSTYVSGADCTNDAGYSEFIFEAGKSHRLRLVNTGADGAQQFSIDDHEMTVIANDFVPIEPYDTNVVTIGIGQRTDVVVKAGGDPGKSYWMRSIITCSNTNQPEALAIIYYDRATNGSLPSTTAQRYGNAGCANDDLTQTVPSYPIAIEEPETTQTVTMTVSQNETGSWLWYMNDNSFFGDTSRSMLLLAKEGNISFTEFEPLIYNMGSNSSFRFIVNNESPIWHPMHMHGHNMFAEGDGTWDGRIVRPSNPQRRDTQQVRPNGYMRRSTQKNPDDVVITMAIRTPLTKAFKGGFKDTGLDYMVYALLKKVAEESKLDLSVVEDICLGNVGDRSSTVSAYIVRAAMLAAGFPHTAGASSVNRFCSSGLKAVQDIANEISVGSIECGVAIGAESMTTGGDRLATPFHEAILQNQEAADCMQPMGQTSENVANDFNISREDMDRYANECFRRAEVAQKAGWFDDEIVPITTKVKDPKSGEMKEVILTRDEGPRYGTTVESLGKIKPAFPDFGNKTTGGNASQVTDGAAAVVLMKRSKAIALGQPIMAKFCGATVAGVPPRIMGIGPSVAIPKLLSQFQLTKDDIDIIEINEAFASMAVYCLNVLGLDHKKVNPRGGAIALGHPLGATGARQICTILSEARRTKKKICLTSMCIGTGQGMAGLFVNEQV
ncbi:hypothetical protein EPUS_01572 [Endocarpon pusillum Z07020]|uniref:Uncharacterized protein n=1 Tax=Endocarpon pusillum (strain Z07020 / HMAS-L-300199) TaxID=1263415 RepID=U1GDR5_ENDPU|nr:uncharacterized protein EPUS_01572 [Endocarpon pusillum Z07020]ERF75742.1 hypothetical protein EPUS_01572 [Endocarpon pusillum Z07020]